VLVEGPAAAELADRHFDSPRGRTLAGAAAGAILFGRWRHGESSEEIVACRRDDRRVEIHCHGGSQASEAILRVLSAAGARRLDWRTWLRESLGVSTATEARIALAEAPTERTARILLDQMQGALSREVETAAALIRSGDLTAAGERLAGLLSRAELGLRLTCSWRVVLAGEPNVGKSTLVNALVGYQRAVVFDQPGATRDVVTATAALDGWPVQFADTAGLRAAENPLEAAGVERARRELADCDLPLLVFDASRPWSPADETLRAPFPHALLVHNKRDLAPPSDSDRPPGINTCALSGHGLPELIAAIVERIVPEPPAAGEGVPFTSRQIDLLARAASALQRQKGTAALRRLSELDAPDRQTAEGQAPTRRTTVL